jgi:hypothetical protein
VQWALNKKGSLALAALWSLLTLSLSGWWMMLGMNQNRPGVEQTAEMAARQYRMFFWEGSFLLFFVAIGGGFLFYSIYRDQKRHEEVRRFFSTFTHELKTSLTSLRLQAEILEEDPRNRENENLRRLLRDVVRLELQLENALFLAQAESGKLFLEEIPLQKTVQALSVHWPQLKVQVEADARIRADQRALECILKNLFQNACVHGKATKVSVSARREGGRLGIRVTDNGSGFSGERLDQLGQAFVRHSTRSGSGIGLYLSRILASRMKGRLEFAQAGDRGFMATLELEGRTL